MQWIQLTAGIGTAILEVDKELKYLPKGWVQELHRKMVDEGIKVTITNYWLPTPRRTDDTLIMDYVIFTFPEADWSPINQC